MAISVVESDALRSAYREALDRGDHDLARGVLTTTTGFLVGVVFQYEGTPAQTEVLSFLLSQQESEAVRRDLPWCTDILDMLRRRGVIEALSI